MELKRQKIQLGGISRIPTDHMTKDGECAESLNVVSDNGEIVSSLFPLEVEADGLPASWATDCRLIFVHTTSTYTNYILIEGQNIGTWNGTKLVPFLTMAEGETLSDITAIGNTLVIATSESMYYVLYKDGEYKFLGSQLPKPAVVFWGDEKAEKYYDYKEYFDDYNMTIGNKSYNDGVQYIFDRENIGDLSDYDDSDDADAKENAIKQGIWNAYDSAVAYISKFNNEVANGTVCYQPYFFRYALKLYDGTYAMQSVPVLVGCAVERPCIIGTSARGGTNNNTMCVAFLFLYRIRAKLMEQISADWSDIVTSIDIFCSEPINMIDPGDGSISEKDRLQWIYYAYKQNGSYGVTSQDIMYYDASDSQKEDKLLGYNVFYLVGSFLVDNGGFAFDDGYDPAQTFTANQEDLYNGITFKRPDTDTLVTHTSTASDSWDDFECDHTLLGQNLETLNNRLAMWDVTKVLGGGLPVLNSQSEVPATESDGSIVPSEDYPVYEYRFRYVLSVNGQTKTVDGKSWLGTDVFDPYCVTDDPGFLKTYGWLAYPDVNCKKVLMVRRQVVSYSEGGGYSYSDNGDFNSSDIMELPMKEHPFLNCAYAWLGWGVELWSETYAAQNQDQHLWLDEDDMIISEDNTVAVDNYVYQSGVDNPFTFPMEGRYSFDYAILGIGAVNLPISEGQYGQFPLYVFTKGGIYAMAMNTDGTFASSAPFSRDVALSRNTITEIDRGVVFATCKGVKVIEGGQITDISPLMIGEHQTIPEGIKTMLQTVTSFHNEKVNISAAQEGYYDTRAFMQFIEQSHAVYDYVGQRIVFFNEEYTYQYVYRIPTASWHKVVLYNVYTDLTLDVQPVTASAGDIVSGTVERSDLIDAEGYIKIDDNLMVATCYNMKYVHIYAGVNSYPQCYVSAYMEFDTTDGARLYYGVLDLSTALDFTRTDTYNNGNTLGLIYTRTMDFGNPDTFKSIRDLRIRGNYDKGNVRYIMLASNDGKRWVMRKSLRGASFKFYRMILLTKLATGERISYIEFDYEERFTNRLR